MLEQLFRSKRMAEVVNGLMQSFAEEQDLIGVSSSDLFEIFTAYCVVGQDYRGEFEPEELRTGGPHDLGIDAFAVTINGRLYTDADEVRTAVAKAAILNVHFFLIQAKHRPNFEGAVYSRLRADLLELFSDAPLPKKAAPKARNIRDCIKAVYSDVAKFASTELPRLSAWYASLGTARPSSHKSDTSVLMQTLKGTHRFSSVEVKVAGAYELRDLYTAVHQFDEAKFVMTKHVDLPVTPAVNRAVLGVVPARELVNNILVDDQGRRRPWLFHENLRDYLGIKPDSVNAKIQATLRDSARREQFALLNNGITIVSRRMVVGPSEIHLQDPLVVNGCQTCNVLFDNRDQLTDNVYVNLRLIESSDAEFIANLVEATNSQNVLRPDDFTARDRFQRHLEGYFLAQPPDRRVYFERRTRQPARGAPRSKRISRRHLTQSYAAMWLGVPQHVTRYSTLVESQASVLYRPDDDPMLYYTSAIAHLNLGRLFGHGVPVAYRPARYHFLHGIRLHLLGDGPVPRAGAAIAIDCMKIIERMVDPQVATQLIHKLESALFKALDNDGISGLGSVVKTDLFAARFRDAVLAQRQEDRRQTDRLAA
jgi:hypothetical protein